MLKPNNIYQGDCLELMKDIPDNSIDLVLTDPPYGINYQSGKRVISEKFDKLDNDDNDSRFEVYPEFYRVLKDNTVAIIFCSFKNYAKDYIELDKLFDIKNCIIWYKRGGGIGDLKNSLSTDYEMAIICHKGNCNIKGKRVGSVWTISKVNPNLMVHPTEKPIKLILKLIDKFSNKNELVLDPFLGSGTTAVACKELGRKYIGIEISEEYFNISKDRIERTKVNNNEYF